MLKNRLLRALLAPFFAFIDDEDGGGFTPSTSVDRGDDFVPTETDDPAAEAAAAKAALEAEEARKAAEEAGLKAKDDEAAKKAEDEAAAAKKAEDEAAAKDGDKSKSEEEEEEGKGKRRDTRIPLSRHEQILAKERERSAALQAELDKARKQEEKVSSDKFLQEAEGKLETLEEKYNAALVDGKTDEARKLMREIRSAEREISDHKADLKTRAAEARAVETVRYDMTVSQLEGAYPQLVPDSPTYDKAVVAEVLELKDAFQLKGYDAPSALQRAVKYVLGAATAKQKEATTEDEAPAGKKVDDEAGKKVREERAAEAARKAVEAAKGAPPSTSKTGVDSDKLGGTISAKDVMKMSQDDFSKLDEETLARMRGDTV